MTQFFPKSKTTINSSCCCHVWWDSLYLVCLVGSKYCCKGYCMDLLENLALKCNFTYDVYLSLGKLYTVTGYMKGLFPLLISRARYLKNRGKEDSGLRCH